MAGACLLLILSILASNIIITQQQQQCRSVLDLVFVVDGSNSMGDLNFQRQKGSLINLVRTLTIDENQIRVGLVLFSDQVDATITLTGDKETFIAAVNALKYPDFETRTDLGIDAALAIFNQYGRKGSVPYVMMIITDGESTKTDLTLISATAAKNQGVVIFGIGVTNKTAREELNQVVSSIDKVFITKDFITLETSLNNATNRACVEFQCKDAMIDIVFVLDSSSTIGANNFQEMKNFVHDFLMFANVDNGEIRVGLITFGDAANVQFNLNTHMNKSLMNDAINSAHLAPGGANLADALRTVRTTMYTTNGGDRPDVPNVAIVLSGNDVNGNIEQAIAEADLTRGSSVQIYGIGIGHVSTTLIDGIVSRPVEDNRFIINNFTSLTTLVSKVYDTFNRFCETCFMGQTDLWFVVDVSRISESLSRVQSTGDFQNLKNGLGKTIEIIQDPSVANPGVRVGVITFSETSRIVSDISQINSVNNAASAVQQIPGGILQGGASLVSALKNIVTPSIKSSYRSYVALVAPEATFMVGETSGLEVELARLKALGFTVVIFVVKENGALDQLALQTLASGSRYFYYIPGYLELEAAAKNFTRDRLCKGLTGNNTGLCADSGHKEKGMGVVAHPMDCDKYIQCYYNETGKLDLGVVRQCPMGLHWNAANEICSSPMDAQCAYDKCKEDCSAHTMDGSCSAFWDCENGVSKLMCCQQNYTFVAELGCQLDDSCTDSCTLENWCGKCQKKPNWAETSGYDVMILSGHVWMPRPCLVNDFDIVHCDCTAPRGQDCHANRTFDFKDPETIRGIEGGMEKAIRVFDIQKSAEGITLGDTSVVHVDVYNQTGEDQQFTLEFRFQELEKFSPYGQTVFSSGLHCQTAHSLLVSANDQFIFAEVIFDKRIVAEVKVPTKGLNKDEFKDLVLCYSNGVLALSVSNGQTQYIATTNVPDISLSCGLDIGEGLNKHSFNGTIQKISIYYCAWPLLY